MFPFIMQYVLNEILCVDLNIIQGKQKSPEAFCGWVYAVQAGW